jgi:molecular chaperone GrpE
LKPETEQDHQSAVNEEELEQTASSESQRATQEAESDPASELEHWKQVADDHYQKYLRSQADFDNFRRRSRQEKEEFAKYASQKLIEALLPVVDNFERAMAATHEQQDIEAMVKGISMIHRQLKQLLEKEGLKPIDAVGHPFNPEIHQAVMQVAAEDGMASGVIVEQLQKGYILKDKVIRPSMVKVTE